MAGQSALDPTKPGFDRAFSCPFRRGPEPATRCADPTPPNAHRVAALAYAILESPWANTGPIGACALGYKGYLRA